MSDHGSRKYPIPPSLDVSSLFTNAPLDETIQMCLTKLYSFPNPPTLPPNVLKKNTAGVCDKEKPFRL